MRAMTVFAIGMLLAGCAANEARDSLTEEIDGFSATTVRLDADGSFLTEVHGAGTVVMTMEAAADLSTASLDIAGSDHSQVMDLSSGTASPCADFDSELACMNSVAVTAYRASQGEDIGYKAGCDPNDTWDCRNRHYKCVFGYIFCCDGPAS